MCKLLGNRKNPAPGRSRRPGSTTGSRFSFEILQSVFQFYNCANSWEPPDSSSKRLQEARFHFWKQVLTRIPIVRLFNFTILSTGWQPLESSFRKFQEASFHSWKQVPLETLQSVSQSVVQFYNCVNRLGTARIQLQEAPGGQIPLLEAGSHLKPYSQSVQLFNFTIA